LDRALKIGRPLRSISKPQLVQVHPPHNICRSDVGFLMAGTLAPHLGQATAFARLTAPISNTTTTATTMAMTPVSIMIIAPYSSRRRVKTAFTLRTKPPAKRLSHFET